MWRVLTSFFVERLGIIEDLDLLLILAPLFTDPVVPRPLVLSLSVMEKLQICQSTAIVFLLFGIDKVG